MARTAVPVKHVDRLSVASFTNATDVPGDTVNGMQMFNDGGTVLFIANTTAVARTVSVTLVETVDFQPAGPVVLTIPASATINLVGPFPTNLYGNVLEFSVSSTTLNFAGFSLL